MKFLVTVGKPALFAIILGFGGTNKPVRVRKSALFKMLISKLSALVFCEVITSPTPLTLFARKLLITVKKIS